MKQKYHFSTYCIRDDYCQRTTKSAKDSDILIDWYSTKRNRYEKHFRRGLHHYSFIKQKYQRSAGNTQEKAMCYSHCAPEIWILTRKSYRWKRWPFFPFQVSPVPHQQEITDSSRGRSFTVFLGDTLQRQVYGRRWKAFTKGNKGELVTVSTLFMLL